MPPRYAYWTILAGGLPTAFRAVEREELMPTFQRLREKHPDAEMKWFARGKLWDSPEEARASGRGPQDEEWRRSDRGGDDVRDRNWRPGGDHRDPRQAFKDAKKARNIDRRQAKFERKHGAPRGSETGAPRREDWREQTGVDRKRREPAGRDGGPGSRGRDAGRDGGASGPPKRDWRGREEGWRPKPPGRHDRGGAPGPGATAKGGPYDRPPLRERPHGDPLRDDQRARHREGSRHGDTHGFRNERPQAGGWNRGERERKPWREGDRERKSWQQGDRERKPWREAKGHRPSRPGSEGGRESRPAGERGREPWRGKDRGGERPRDNAWRRDADWTTERLPREKPHGDKL